MPSYQATALVLRKTKLGEADTILTLLADDGRQVRAVARGLRRPGSRFGGRLEPFSVVDLLLATGRSLDIVREARTVTTNAVLREDLDRCEAAAVVVDLIDKISLEGQGEPRLFPLATRTLTVMGHAPVDALPALVAGFLIKAVALHGSRPELGACVRCGGEPTGGTAFSLAQGGVLCGRCAVPEGEGVRLAEGVRSELIRLLRSTMAEIAASPPPRGVSAACLGFLRVFLAYHLPVRLKTLERYVER